MNREEFEESSDSSDEDYVPKNEQEDFDSNSDKDEENEELSDSAVKNSSSSKKKTKRRSKKILRKNESDRNLSPKQMTDEQKKEVEEDVWASFIKDTGFPTKGNKSENTSLNNLKDENSKSLNTEEKVKANTLSTDKVAATKEENPRCSVETTLFSKANKRQSTGLNGLLNHLKKKPKLSTLEKSKLDWNQFKKEENIEAELNSHNKGKDGYLERQDFLERTDLRRFEIEKEIRSIERSKRVK